MPSCGLEINKSISIFTLQQQQQRTQEHTAPMDLMALSETLKLLFNVTHFHLSLIHI